MLNNKTSLLKRNPTFRNFLTAMGVSLLGSQIFDFAIPLYVIKRTDDVFALSLAAVALNLPFFLMAPVTGYCVDNFNKRKVMLNSDIGQVILLSFLVLYDFLPVDFPLWPVFLAVFFAKTCMIHFETVATFQLIPSLVGKKDLSEANTWFLSTQRLIQILAPLSAGALMTFFGMRACILVNMLSFGATLYFVFRMKNLNELIETDPEFKKPKKKMTVGNVVDSFLDSVRYVWNSPLFKPFILMMFVWNASPIIPNTPALTYYFTKVKGFTAAEYGMIGSAFGFLSIFGFLAAGRVYERYRFQNTFSVAGLLLAAMGTLAICSYNYPFILILFFAISRVGSSLLSFGTFVIRQANIPRSKMGGINASLRMFFMASTPLSAYLQGPMLHHLGVFSTMAVGAICLWGTAWYAIRVGRVYQSESESTSTQRAA